MPSSTELKAAPPCPGSHTSVSLLTQAKGSPPVVRRKGELSMAARRRLYPHRVHVHRDYAWSKEDEAALEAALVRLSGGDYWRYAGSLGEEVSVLCFKTEEQAVDMTMWLYGSGLWDRPRKPKAMMPAERYAKEEAALIAWGKQTRALHVTLQVYRWARWATASDVRAFEWAVAVLRTMNPSLHKPDAERGVKLMLWWAQREHREWLMKQLP